MAGALPHIPPEELAALCIDFRAKEGTRGRKEEKGMEGKGLERREERK
jgi:hypothetical protein